MQISLVEWTHLWLKSIGCISWYSRKHLPAVLWGICVVNHSSVSGENQETDFTSSLWPWSKMLMQTHSVSFYVILNSFFYWQYHHMVCRKNFHHHSLSFSTDFTNENSNKHLCARPLFPSPVQSGLPVSQFIVHSIIAIILVNNFLVSVISDCLYDSLLTC